MQRIVLSIIVLYGLGLVVLQPLASAQDATAGKQLFAQCGVCHSIDGSNGVGPTLLGVYGRKAGSVSDFRYSRAMKNANITWDDNTLEAYLADPQKLIPGNLMPFSGLSDPKQRADVIAYLKTLK